MITNKKYQQAIKIVKQFEEEERKNQCESFGCVCCKQTITLHPSSPLHGDSLENEIWDGGAMTCVSLGYGSRFDMQRLYIALCDNCIEIALKGKIIKLK